MGTAATCTGDPARRAGNEYLFQTLAQANVETLNGMGVDKKVKAGRIRLILLDSLGAAAIASDTPEDVLRATLAAAAAH
ncbi:MAG: hypothetical protein HC807_00385 [Gammaproteobacteria bacterium]|nr:hypothetical protein [Gammaproteobacteria bacterium]